MKTKFWRKSLAALLLVVLTVSAMAGFNAVPTSVKASEDLVADEVTAYGLTDLGAETEVVDGAAEGRPLVYAGPNVTKSLGATDSTTNVSVILETQAETPEQVVYYIGKADAANMADGSGYAIAVRPQSQEMAICKDTATNANVLATGVVPNNKNYEVEFGIVDMRDGQGTLVGRKVYVKIDGADALSYVDTNLEHTLGKNVAFYANGALGAGALVTVAPRSLKADETTVYGLTDLGAETSVVVGVGAKQYVGATKTASNTSIVFDVTTTTPGAARFYIGKQSATEVLDATGYVVVVWPRFAADNFAIYRGTVDAANLLTYGTVPQESGGVSYELEYGIVDMRDGQGQLIGRKVYANYNGETELSYIDLQPDYTVGTHVWATEENEGQFTITTSVCTLKADSTKIYSLYDLMGVNSVNLTTAHNLLGSTSTTSNVRVKLGIMVNFTDEFLFSLAKQTESHYDGTGYQFKINPANNWIRIFGANNDWRLVEAPLNLTGGADAIVVEFGIIDMRDSQGTLRARKVYATANGSELISYYDYNVAHPLGNNVLVKMPANTGMGTFNQAISSQVVKYDEIAEYRQADNFTSPVAPDGYVFAGWYADESCAPETALDATTVSGSAYAKFVDAKLSEVRAQISASTTAESEKADIRFLTSVDGLNYSKIGYKITAKGSTKEVGNNSVYKQLTVTLLEGESFDLAPDQVFGQQANYFKAYVIKNIPNVDFNENIEVTPYWITLDGTTVYGTTAVKTVAQGIEAE